MDLYSILYTYKLFFYFKIRAFIFMFLWQGVKRRGGREGRGLTVVSGYCLHLIKILTSASTLFH